MNLKTARKNAGLTLEQAAIQFGISKPTMFRYEHGLTRIPLNMAVKIRDVYNLTNNQLIALVEKESA